PLVLPCLSLRAGAEGASRRPAQTLCNTDHVPSARALPAKLQEPLHRFPPRAILPRGSHPHSSCASPERVVGPAHSPPRAARLRALPQQRLPAPIRPPALPLPPPPVQAPASRRAASLRRLQAQG